MANKLIVNRNSLYHGPGAAIAIADSRDGIGFYRNLKPETKHFGGYCSRTGMNRTPAWILEGSVQVITWGHLVALMVESRYLPWGDNGFVWVVERDYDNPRLDVRDVEEFWDLKEVNLKALWVAMVFLDALRDTGKIHFPLFDKSVEIQLAKQASWISNLNKGETFYATMGEIKTKFPKRYPEAEVLLQTEEIDVDDVKIGEWSLTSEFWKASGPCWTLDPVAPVLLESV